MRVDDADPASAPAASHEPRREPHVDDAESSAGHDEHETAALGPIDWPAWRAGLLGVAVAGLVVLFLYLAITR